MMEMEYDPRRGVSEQAIFTKLITLQHEYLQKYKDELVAKRHLPEVINSLVADKIADAERFFEAYKDRCLSESKIDYWYLIGKIYTLSCNYTNKAINALVKAIKLDPRVEIWNMLGEAYWNNSEIEMAEKCFNNALDVERNPVSLRNLSIIARKGGESDCLLKKENTEKGISLAKEAVSLDIKDGASWGVLGNSYISAYFNIRPDSSYAYKALSAYKQAEKQSPEGGLNNGDLYHNKYVALKFVEMYLEALESVSKSLEYSPMWQLAINGRNSLLKYLDDVNTCHATNGKLKPKKVMVLRKSITKADLGQCILNRYKNTTISALNDGPNPKCYIFGKVTWNLQVDDSFPFTIGILDGNGDSIVVTIYNLSQTKGFITGESIVIPDPELVRVNFTYSGKKYIFPKVRIDNPEKLLVNGKPIPSNYLCSFGFVSGEPKPLD